VNPIVLIVDDEKPTRDGLRMALEDKFETYLAADAKQARQILKSEPVDILLTDLRLGADSGMDLLEEALALPKPPVGIMMTAYGSVDTAVEAMRRGAWHFVTKPLHLDEVELLLMSRFTGSTVSSAAHRRSRKSPNSSSRSPPRGPRCSSRASREPERNWWRTPSTNSPGARPTSSSS
jgi:DNA-binding NtrC family response regulator